MNENFNNIETNLMKIMKLNNGHTIFRYDSDNIYKLHLNLINNQAFNSLNK